jgi:hypothetical protein
VADVSNFPQLHDEAQNAYFVKHLFWCFINIVKLMPTSPFLSWAAEAFDIWQTIFKVEMNFVK